jgi:hypothetical protein
LKGCKSPDIVQTIAELFPMQGKELRSDIHKCIKPIWSEEELVQYLKFEAIFLFVKKIRSLTSNYWAISLAEEWVR